MTISEIDRVLGSLHYNIGVIRAVMRETETKKMSEQHRTRINISVTESWDAVKALDKLLSSSGQILHREEIINDP